MHDGSALIPFSSIPVLRAVVPISAVLACALTLAGLAPRPALAQASTDNGVHPPPASTDAGPSRNAARSRLRECGHQWSGMKKSGAAAGMTWKDYSQGCLAKQ